MKKPLFLLLLIVSLCGCNQVTTQGAVTTTTNLTTTTTQTTTTQQNTTQSTTTLYITTSTTTTEVIAPRNIELRIDEGFLQWRYTDEDVWVDLYDIDSLNGLGVSSMLINEVGELIITYTDDTTQNLGELVKLHLVQFLDKEGRVISSQLVRNQEAAVSPEPAVYEGYLFSGWSEEFSQITSNLVVSPLYTPNVYNLSFDTQGGNNIEGLSFTYKETINLPIPTKLGYNFLGWFKGIDPNSSQVFSDTELTEDLILYARWQKTNIVYVTTGEELLRAVADYTITEIHFSNDIIIYETLYIYHELTINGNGYMLGSYSKDNLIDIREQTTLIPDINIYPSNTKITLSNFDLVALSDNPYVPNPLAILLYGVHNVNLSLESINLQGHFTYGIRIDYSTDVAFNMNNSQINSRLIGILASSSKYDMYLTNSIIYSEINLYFTNSENSYLYSKNTEFNVVPYGANEPAVIYTNNNGVNRYQFYNSYFNLMSDVNTPQRIARTTSEVEYQAMIFDYCFYEIGYPVFSYLFSSSADKTNFTHYGATVILKEGVTSIPNSGFENLGFLRTIILPSTLVSIGDYAFVNASLLKNVIIPEGVESIGIFAFSGATKLSNVYLPSTVTTIGSSAFLNNHPDLTIYYNELADQELWSSGWNGGNYTTVIAQKAFYDEGIGYVIQGDYPYEAAIIDFYSFEVKEIVIPEFINCESISYPITVIGMRTFAYERNLIRITLPKSITIIESHAFNYALNLEEVIFEEQSALTEIGEYAFHYCWRLKTITIPPLLQEISAYTFYECRSLFEVDLSQTTQLTKINRYAFNNNYVLQSITIPDTVTVIDDYAFYNNYSLNEIIISENSSLTSVGLLAFYSASKVKSLYIPKTVTSIGQSAFSYMSQLEELIFAEDSELETIGVNAFAINVNLVEVYFPDSVTTIGAGIFTGCSKLETVYLPQTITVIPISAFYNCTSLSNIIFQDITTLTDIGSNAFYNNVSIVSFFIPINVTYVGSAVFGSSPYLVVYCEAASKPAAWESNWSTGVGSVIWGYTSPV